ncbi:MAG: bifunctional phosphopantothenoylcysteine decarboxylase/phosphopantothenate--cysteine ligase CoaBC [Bacteroidota bacterium]|nr:bifunctional phosphopantothenoylcysteine decarboxylase/phosphopantothenate--cysteine ligase CoaBC [Odoribacter sp.]MDP3644798.1 bifunctional phosphopantothenoylcysteine decarboxylase/phosphopantothenate--cysteine ligase CoaBC [Bacteroidota bacterium]
MRLSGKHIVLGLTGSIAAYKAAYLLRGLVKEGAEVQVVMTPSAKEFITPVTMSALSGKPVASEFFSANDGSWYSHVDMGQWADLLLIAPATASTIGKMAHGICDNLLLTTYMSAKCPVMIAPAMDLDMFNHPSTLANLEKLRSYGNLILEPGEGELASGLYGKGRMEEPENIVEEVVRFFSQKKKLLNKHFLVTAGPTYEKIDPVRFIGNYSSGKMGYAIANELACEGANVTIVSGPVQIQNSNPEITVIPVESASEMYEHCLRIFPETDGAVMCAAVADFTPEHYSEQKVKRQKDNLKLNLKPTTDIAAALGQLKTEKQLLVGFALETNNELVNAFLKLSKKNLDFVVLNSMNVKGAGFIVDTNEITIIGRDNNPTFFELKSKAEVAKDIVIRIISEMEKKYGFQE